MSERMMLYYTGFMERNQSASNGLIIVQKKDGFVVWYNQSRTLKRNMRIEK
jgi:hypothetical protein